jgi:hypothetical protein
MTTAKNMLMLQDYSRKNWIQILTAVIIKIMVFRIMTLHSLVDGYQYFGEVSRLQIQNRPSSTLKTKAGTYVLDWITSIGKHLNHNTVT